MKIIDSHTHVLATTGGKTYTPEMLVEEMKEAGVDYALIFPYEAETITGVVPTEKVIEVGRGHKNLVAIGTVTDLMPLLGVEELESLDITVAKIWLSMNSKLDYIIKLLKQSGEGVEEKEGLCKDISGKGIKMIYKGNLSAGQCIHLRIHPPTFPPLSVVALGRILRAERTALCREGEIETAVEFDTIHEDDREEIISYVFKRQRELLRARRET